MLLLLVRGIFLIFIRMSGAYKHINTVYCRQLLLAAQTHGACLLFNFGKKSNYFPTCKDFHN